MARPVRIAIAICGLAAPIMLAGADFARAEEADATELPEQPVRITIGKVPDGEGRPVYADHQAFSGSGSVIRFSTTRPRGNLAAPSGARREAGVRQPLATAPAGPRRMPAYFPLAARAMTSGFGPRYHPILGGMRSHSGVDLAAPAGTPVSATADGVVSYANWNGGYGIMVAVLHSGGVETRYGHLMRIAVAPGQRVRTGEVVGWVGSTGLSTGPHVHYEVRIDGRAVSPWSR